MVSLVVGFTGLVIAADEDRTIPYTGRLEEAGAPVTGTRAFVFNFYAAPVGGAPLSAGIELDAVDVRDGLFAVELGPVSDQVLAADPLFLEVAVGTTTDDAVVLGRQRVFAVPYAMRGRGDDTFAIDRPVEGPLRVDGVLTLGENANGSGARSLAFARDGTDDPNAGKIAYRATWDANALSIVGAGENPSRRVRVWDDLSVSRDLDVAGDASVAGTLSVSGNVALAPGAPLNAKATGWCDCQGGSNFTFDVNNHGGVEVPYQYIAEPETGWGYYQCRDGRFLVGMYFGCDAVHCIEQFKCCRPCGLQGY